MKFALRFRLFPQASTITPPKTWDEEGFASGRHRSRGSTCGPVISRRRNSPRADRRSAHISVYYPVEAAGYFDMIQKVGPKPIIEPGTLKTADDWVRKGSGFRNDIPAFRVFDPKVIWPCARRAFARDD
jgi:hypothetical protein